MWQIVFFFVFVFFYWKDDFYKSRGPQNATVIKSDDIRAIIRISDEFLALQIFCFSSFVIKGQLAMTFFWNSHFSLRGKNSLLCRMLSAHWTGMTRLLCNNIVKEKISLEVTIILILFLWIPSKRTLSREAQIFVPQTLHIGRNV